MGGVGSGGWNKAKVIDYSMLKRYSVARLLQRMRSLTTPDAVKDKIALEVVSRDIGKVVLDQSTHQHYSLTQLAMDLAAERKNGNSIGAGPEGAIEADALHSTAGILEACLKRQPVVEASGDNALSSGQSENDSPKQ